MTNQISGLEQVSGRANALWALLTISGSILAAIVSASIYVHDNVSKLTALEARVAAMSQQLSRTSPIIIKGANFNGFSTPQCDSHSFIVGLRIGVDPNLNPHGEIHCAKIQLAMQ